MRTRRGVLGALALLTVVAVAEAQESQEPVVQKGFTVGSRIRIRSPGVAGQPEGTVTAIDGGVLTLMAGRGTVRVPLASIAAGSRVEIRTRKSSRAKGTVIGAVTGALGFLLLVASTNGCVGAEAGRELEALVGVSDAECFGSAALAGGAAGALIGLAVSHGERWEALPLGESRRVGDLRATGLRWHANPRARSLGVSVSVRF